MDKGGTSIYQATYLDRQNLHCQYSRVAMNYFRIEPAEWTSPTQMRFNYQCRGFSGVTGAAAWYSTWSYDWGGGNTRALSAHSVECPGGTVMRRWQLYRPNANAISFAYECLTASISWCQDLETGYNDSGGGSVQYLDRHPVSCPGNSVLQRWRLFNWGSDGWDWGAGQYKIQFRCCYPT